MRLKHLQSEYKLEETILLNIKKYGTIFIMPVNGIKSGRERRLKILQEILDAYYMYYYQNND